MGNDIQQRFGDIYFRVVDRLSLNKKCDILKHRFQLPPLFFFKRSRTERSNATFQ